MSRLKIWCFMLAGCAVSVLAPPYASLTMGIKMMVAAGLALAVHWLGNREAKS